MPLSFRRPRRVTLGQRQRVIVPERVEEAEGPYVRPTHSAGTGGRLASEARPTSPRDGDRPRAGVPDRVADAVRMPARQR